MLSSTIKNDLHNSRALLWLITLMAGLFACWAIFLENGRINDDGVLYIEAARLFAAGEWKQGLNLYAWPLYPFLISVTHQLTGLSLQYAAQLLSGLFFMLATYAFTLLLVEAGGNRRTVIAGVLLLFSCSYIVRNILPMVMRDQGFWAFYLCSLLFLLRFYRKDRLPDALAWQICAIVAMLFRIEGVTYVALLPLALLTQSETVWAERIKRLVKAYSLILLAAIAVMAVLLAVPSLKFSDLGRLYDSITVVQGAYAQITHGLIDKAHVIGESVLGEFLSDYGMQGLILTLIAVIIGKIATASGWLALILTAISNKISAAKPASDAKRLFIWAAGLGLLNLCVILLCNFILPSRIAIPIAWIILAFASFSLASLYDKWQLNRSMRSNSNKLFWLVAIILAIQLVLNLLPQPAGYNDEQEAVAWIKKNTAVGSTVFYDNARLRYYAGQPFVDRGIPDWDRVTGAIADGSINQYDYLVLHMSNKKPEREKYLEQILPHKLAASIKSSKNKRILIFARQK